MYRDRRFLAVVVVSLTGSWCSYLAAADNEGCPCGPVRAERSAQAERFTPAGPVPVRDDMVSCRLRVEGTLCDGRHINTAFVGVADYVDGTPDWDAAWADAEAQYDAWRLIECDCTEGSCDLTTSREGCVPPEQAPLMLPEAAAARAAAEPAEAASSQVQFFECERRGVAGDGSRLVASETDSDPAVALAHSYQILLGMAASHGGIVTGTVRTRVKATRVFRCVARVQAKKGKHLIDYELDGVGATPELAELAVEASIALFEQQTEASTKVLARACRSVPILLDRPMEQCVFECEAMKPGHVVTAGRLAASEEAACAAAKAVAEVLADRHGGAKRCRKVVGPRP